MIELTNGDTVIAVPDYKAAHLLANGWEVVGENGAHPAPSTSQDTEEFVNGHT